MSSTFDQKDSPATPVLVENLTVAYGNAPPILENLNFSIKAGEIFCILGGSGCGKSSVVHSLIGLLPPRSGRVSIFGKDMWGDGGSNMQKCRRDFGMMYQRGALFGSLNLLENVSMPLKKFTNMSAEDIETASRLKLSLVDLSGFEYHLPTHISGGMQKRAAIARAMALDPKLIFLDEPGAGLDPITSAELDELILTLSRNLNIAFGMISHELGSIMNIVDRAIMLDKKAKGIIAEGPPKELAEISDPPEIQAFFRRKVLND